MNRDDNMLDKLAMEMDAWPEKPFGPTTMPASTVGGIRKSEWLQRRAELINKPSWDDAPEWAQWLAQDADGEWRAFKNFPKTGPDHWFSSERISKGKMSKGTIPNGHDWRQTLEARPTFDESRADAIGQNGNDGNHYRELNPTSSSLTHSQAVEAARDTGVCSDGLPCGQDIGQGPVYCAGCPNEPMTPEEEELPAQEKHDCPRCGGCFYSPPHDECPCRERVASKYHREIKPGVFVDVYDVLSAWRVENPALQHLIKKALQPGGRGHKTLEQDMADIVASAKRAQEIES